MLSAGVISGTQARFFSVIIMMHDSQDSSGLVGYHRVFSFTHISVIYTIQKIVKGVSGFVLVKVVSISRSSKVCKYFVEPNLHSACVKT